MITFSPTVRQIIADGKAEVFFFVFVKNGDGSLFRASTTHHTSFKAGDNINYVADDFIISADPPQQSSTVDREQYKLTLADPEFTTAAEAENGLVGKKVEVRLGFINPDNGKPLVQDMADTFIVYKGKVDGLSSSFDTVETGELLFVMSCASPMVSLDQSRGVYLSRDEIRSRTPTDSCCDKIYTGSSALTIKWGRQ